MGSKKVGSITLEYDRGDGVIESQAFDAEFHNALITGDVSALDGTFTGKLTANAVNALDNLHITGRSAAITKIDRWAVVNPQTNGFNDDGIYRNVCQQQIEVPEGMSGAFCAVAIQYKINDQRGDNANFISRYRILQDGQAYYTGKRIFFGIFYGRFNYHIHEIVLWLSGAGTHTVSMAWLWEPNETNVYPQFENIIMRTDLIRK